MEEKSVAIGRGIRFNKVSVSENSVGMVPSESFQKLSWWRPSMNIARNDSEALQKISSALRTASTGST